MICGRWQLSFIRSELVDTWEDASAPLLSLPDVQDGGENWGGATALAVPAGPASDALRYQKSLALQLWLFGYELPDTIMVFTPTELVVLTSSKKGAWRVGWMQFTCWPCSVTHV